ncbi:major facilitator superfamily domain-containing protein [Scleroderma yunnanense]
MCHHHQTFPRLYVHHSRSGFGLSMQTSPAVVQLPEGKPVLDIEHTLVEDDPRRWSDARKTVTLIVVSGASVIAGLFINIQNPANAQIQQELHATSSQISLTLSLSSLALGNVSLLWSATSEIKGRKVSSSLSACLSSINIAFYIGFSHRSSIQEYRADYWSSAVLTIGAATLADIYDPHQRGTMMGIYYVAPLLGPSIGPILGGILAQELGWRAIFWFLAIWGGIIFLAFLLLFTDTFRRERSLTYQNVLKRRMCQPQLSKATTVENTERKANGSKSHQGRKDVEACQLSVENREDLEGIKGVTLSLADVNPFPPRFTYVIHIYPSWGQQLIIVFRVNVSRLKADNGDVSYPEMRLQSAKFFLWWLPPSVIGYAWVCQEHAHISAMCAMLFLIGFLLLSSSAVAANSSFRGTIGFIAVEVAVPLQDTIGDGGLYMIWAGLMLFAELMILWVLYRGKQWREVSVKREVDGG